MIHHNNNTDAEELLSNILFSWIDSKAFTRVVTAENIAVKVGIMSNDFQEKDIIDFITEAFWAGYSVATELEFKKLNLMKSLMNNCIDCEVNLADYPSKEHQQ